MLKLHWGSQHSMPGRTSVFKRLILIFAIVVLQASAASAQFYIVREVSTKKCRVVETLPTEATWVQVGPASFKTHFEAQSQVMLLCKERL